MRLRLSYVVHAECICHNVGSSERLEAQNIDLVAVHFNLNLVLLLEVVIG